MAKQVTSRRARLHGNTQHRVFVVHVQGLYVCLMLLRSTAKSITDKSRRIISENWFLCTMGISLTLIRHSVVHLLPERGAWSCSRTWSSDQCLRSRSCVPAHQQPAETWPEPNRLVLPAPGWGKQTQICLHLITALFTFFPPNLPLGWEVLVLPILGMVSGRYYPTGRKRASTLPTNICPQPMKSPAPNQKLANTHCTTVSTECCCSFCSVPWKKSHGASKTHQNIIVLPYTSVFSSLRPLFKMWTESRFYLISELVQAHISSTSGTISAMNCRWSY